MRYFFIIPLFILTSCTQEVPNPPIERILETEIITSTGSPNTTPDTPPRSLSEGEIKALVESELAKNNLAGRWAVELGDITEIEANDTDGQSYAIYEGGLSGSCTTENVESCSGERFFLVTDGSEALYFEHTADIYQCDGIDTLLSGDILDLSRELFCP